jgi:hypothetical protein
MLRKLRILRNRTRTPFTPARGAVVCSVFLAVFVGGCEARDALLPGSGAESESGAPVTPQDEWWANLSAPCGSAYPGALGYAPPGDAMLEGPELLVVHFDVCGADEIRLPFHIEKMDGTWDRSRTWIFRRTGAAVSGSDATGDDAPGDAPGDARIELRHDHRNPDGSEDETTWYGAWTLEVGAANEQRFVVEDRTWPDGIPRGWRVIIEPGVRYTYGTFRGDDWSWRVDFDLSTPLAELPPPAWGYEGGRGPLR